MTDNLIHDGKDSYDPDRYDLDTHPADCGVCGATLQGVGDRSAVGKYCPECNVSVWIR